MIEEGRDPAAPTPGPVGFLVGEAFAYVVTNPWERSLVS